MSLHKDQVFVRMSVHKSTNMSIRKPVHKSIHMSAHIYTHFYTPASLSTCYHLALVRCVSHGATATSPSLVVGEASQNSSPSSLTLSTLPHLTIRPFSSTSSCRHPFYGPKRMLPSLSTQGSQSPPPQQPSLSQQMPPKPSQSSCGFLRGLMARTL